MVEMNETVSETLKKEFSEEALNSLVLGSNSESIKKSIRAIFSKNARKIYEGYVDDYRNTDNSWIETQVYHFHAENSEFDQISFQAGDDANQVSWKTIDENLVLYANHAEFVKKAVVLLQSRFSGGAKN
eukprot:Sdes_comp19843_c0_seq2m12061